MKQIITILVALLAGFSAVAQTGTDGIYVDGNVYMSGNSDVQIYGDVTLAATAQAHILDSAKVAFYGNNFKAAAGAQVLGADGTIAFNYTSASAAPQTLDGGNNTFNNIEINNPSGVVLTNTNTRIAGNVQFTAGHLHVGSNDAILGANATMTGYDAAKYVVTNANGHLVKENMTAAFVFPVGQNINDYTPATVAPNASNTIAVAVATYANSASVEAGSNGIDRTWNIFGTNNSGATISLQHNSNTNQASFTTGSNFITRYGSTANNTGDNASLTAWQSNTPAASTVAAGTETNSRAFAALATAAYANEANYSKSSNTTNPLPLTLVAFNGRMMDCNNAELVWNTATENGAASFEVEQSADGRSFQTVATVAAKGTAATYTTTARQEVGTFQYRLKMVAQNGKAAYSKIISLTSNCGTQESFVVAPNPLTGSTISLQFTTANSGAATAVVLDAQGRVYAQQSVAVATGANTFAVNLSEAAAGMYFVRIIGSNWATQSVKLVVAH